MPLAAGLAVFAWIQLGTVENSVRERCTESWDGATLVDVAEPIIAPQDVGRVGRYRIVELAGRSFEIWASANKWTGEGSLYRLPFQPERTSYGFTMVTRDRETFDALAPLCIRASFRGEEWERRAHPADGYMRADGSAVGGAGARNGPEWPANEEVHLMLLILLDGERYILDAGEVRIVLVV